MEKLVLEQLKVNHTEGSKHRGGDANLQYAIIFCTSPVSLRSQGSIGRANSSSSAARTPRIQDRKCSIIIKKNITSDFFYLLLRF